MPQLAALYNKYQEQGLHIFGIESQGSTKQEIVNIAKAKNTQYQLTVQSLLKGASVEFIPAGFLFSADGKLSGENLRGKALEDKIKVLLAESSAAMAGPGPYVKLASFAAQIKAGANLGQVLKLLGQKKTSKDAAEAQEAEMMYTSLSTAAQRQFENAMAKKEEDPADSVLKFERIALLFSPDEIGIKAKQESDTMKKDPRIKKELEGESVWKRVEAMNNALKPFQRSIDHKNEGFRKQNFGAIQTIVQGCQMLSQHYPGTKAAAKADQLIEEFK